MKRNAIARIIIYSILILVLVGILAAALGAGSFMFHFSSGGEVVEGGFSLPAADIRNLEIEWAAGSITIVRGETEDIVVEESASGEMNDSMTYRLRGDTLEISYAESGIRIGFHSTPKKDLYITVPMDWDCGDLIINSASTDIEAQELSADLLELNTASSDCILTDCNIGKLELDGASCNLNYSGTLDSLDCDGASTDITAVFTNVPNSINLDGASAELDISLPEDCGFRVEMDGMSNRFSSDFSTTSTDDCYVYGDGGCKIEVDSMSTTVRIRNGGHHHTEDCSTPNSNCPDNSHSGNHH